MFIYVYLAWLFSEIIPSKHFVLAFSCFRGYVEFIGSTRYFLTAKDWKLGLEGEDDELKSWKKIPIFFVSRASHPALFLLKVLPLHALVYHACAISVSMFLIKWSIILIIIIINFGNLPPLTLVCYDKPKWPTH